MVRVGSDIGISDGAAAFLRIPKDARECKYLIQLATDLRSNLSGFDLCNNHQLLVLIRCRSLQFWLRLRPRCGIREYMWLSLINHSFQIAPSPASHSFLLNAGISFSSSSFPLAFNVPH